MRKSNSTFKTAFVSESAAELTNNDYFAYVEFDDYACYVLASGITDFGNTEAAKEAVEHLILSFEEKPSMSRNTLLQYMNETNERLFNSSNVQRLKASVIMVVTDYEKFRYVSAGNVRLRMYRQGRLFLNSKDMSLANDLIEQGKSETVLDKHEERHNLFAYLGKKDFFKPYVSKITKLEDTDIISLYSQGLWENVDSQEIDEIFSEASDNPQESVDFLEEVLLSRQPKDLKSYTIVAIFVNKAFRDPERERKRLLYIKIAVISVIVIILLGVIIYFYHSWRQNKVENLDKMITTTMEYMDVSNYKRAQESCGEALKLAQDLKDTEKENDLKNYMSLFDLIIQGNEFLYSNNYHSAYIAFKNAMQNSAASDKNVYDYLNRKLDSVQNHLSRDEFLLLGDAAFNNNNFDEAEGMYLKARERAVAVHDIEGMEKISQAISKIYDAKAKLQEKQDKELAAKKQAAMNNAMKKGDALLAAGNFDGAEAAYLQARNLSDNPADKQFTDNALAKVSNAKEKKELEEKSMADTLKERLQAAEKFEEQGDTAFDEKDFLTAQMYYMRAIESYNDLKEEVRGKNAQKKYDLAGSEQLISRGKKIEAEDTEMIAREFYDKKNFVEAQASANRAKDLYIEIGLKNKADEMDALLQQIATDAAIAEALK